MTQHEKEQHDGICHEQDGCPTEKAVLQRFWRAHNGKLPAPAAAPIEYRYEGGTHWCDLGPAERMRPDFKGVYRLKAGTFPVWAGDPAPSPADERAAFEAWYQEYHGLPVSLDDEGGWSIETQLKYREFKSIRAASASATGAEGAKCLTCNDHGMIGGPSYYAPDEGGEPCPDCAAPQPAAAPSPVEAVAWAVYNGWSRICVYMTEDDARAHAQKAQKNHDLSGSLAAFCVVPLYAAPQPSPVDGRGARVSLLLTHEQASALYVHLVHRNRPEFGWIESPLVAIEEALKPAHNAIHDRGFNAMNRQFFSDDRFKFDEAEMPSEIVPQARAASASQPADERAAFNVAQTCALKHAISSLTADGLEASAREIEALLARAASANETGAEGATWRELCRRLYVELFHCDQQMRSTRDEDGEPHWTQSSVVRDVLADAKAALDGAPVQAAESVAITAGYALVPIEPTPQMRKAAADAWLDCGSKLVLNKAAAAARAAIAAAPSSKEGS